ncbi:U3 small nucleolar RNA-associated protein 8 [[Candida] anglica]|uniref:U3 small nucleolar RNA-associated protein 8 n=1 Tax=[Candida] anglica TaxID=148631 RepID=A0ABP0EFN9_9ASCO
MASLTDSFPLVTLPRISDIRLAQKAVVARPRLANQVVLDVGISRSAICSYILKPTPKLVWSHALSPTTVVDCIDVVELESSAKRFAVGLTDRKSHKLLYILRDGETTSTKTIKTSSKIISTSFSSDREHVYLVLEDCTMQVYKFSVDNEQDDEDNVEIDENINEPIYSNLNKLRNSHVLYHEFIDEGFGLGAKDGLLLLVELVNKKVQVRLLSLDLVNSLEVKTFVLEEVYDDSHFAYESTSGVLYRYSVKSSTLSTYALPNFKLVKTISLAKRFPSTSADSVSIACPAPSRLLLSFDDSVYLLNTKYESILDVHQQEDSNKLVIQSTLSVKGNSLKTSNTFAVYLSHNSKKNDTNLNIINVNVGLGTLNECLGKGFNQISTPKTSTTANISSTFQGLSDLLQDQFVAESSKLSVELSEIYTTLKAAYEEESINKWERIVIPYLKGESWQSIKKSVSANKPYKKKNYEFQVFEVEKDRIIDYNFIHAVVSLIFDKPSSDGSLQFKSSFVPEHSLTYLLTHPLYPHEYARGLLALFDSVQNLRLLRQAVITCPNLSCLEITKQLQNSNDEIFQDVVNRLIDEYSVNQITSTLLDILKSSSNFNLEYVVKKCFALDIGWEIIPAVIDAGGLFGWSQSLIDNVIEDVENQLESLNQNSYNLTLTSQALLLNSTSDVNKKSKKSKKPKKKSQSQQKEDENIIESNKQQDQLNSILTINNTSRKNLLDDGISISKKIPFYSVEKLVL